MNNNDLLAALLSFSKMLMLLVRMKGVKYCILQSNLIYLFFNLVKK